MTSLNPSESTPAQSDESAPSGSRGSQRDDYLTVYVDDGVVREMKYTPGWPNPHPLHISFVDKANLPALSIGVPSSHRVAFPIPLYSPAISSPTPPSLSPGSTTSSGSTHPSAPLTPATFASPVSHTSHSGGNARLSGSSSSSGAAGRSFPPSPHPHRHQRRHKPARKIVTESQKETVWAERLRRHSSTNPVNPSTYVYDSVSSYLADIDSDLCTLAAGACQHWRLSWTARLFTVPSVGRVVPGCTTVVIIAMP
ncbi:hypothetical protein OF83DRAFT_1153563 [Amylostereum chailletii]|nr:hypothetical protein OF83DRAFT_1153563 [Amylostereum chailletii]